MCGIFTNSIIIGLYFLLPLLVIYLIILSINGIKNNWEKQYEWIKKNTMWLALSIGSVLVLVHYLPTLVLDLTETPTAKLPIFITFLIGDFSKTIGTLLLSGGVFAAILKSFQYINIFKQEIQQVIESKEFLENRKDLPEIWAKATSALYKSKYPDISEKIATHIREKFLPNSIPFYYSHSHDIIDISLDEDGYVTIKKTHTYRLKVFSDERIEHTWKMGFTKKDDSDIKTKSRRIEMTIRDQGGNLLIKSNNDIEDKVNTHLSIGKVHNISEGLNHRTTETHNLSGSKEYLIKRVVEFCYDLETDPEGFSSINDRYLDDFTLEVRCSANLEVKFIAVGTENFENIRDESKCFIKKHNGLFFPQQGYRLVIKKII